MGTEMALAAAKSTSSSSSKTSLILIVVVFALLMLFMFRSSRRRQQNSQNTQRQVVNGSRIRTVHGIFGTVVDGDDRNVMVEVAPGVKIKMLRQAIGQVLPDDEPDGVLHTDTDESTDWSADTSSDDSSSEDRSSEERSDLSR
jgi:preprotein translocase subunit YajC